MDDFITKPVAPELLLDKVLVWLRVRAGSAVPAWPCDAVQPLTERSAADSHGPASDARGPNSSLQS